MGYYNDGEKYLTIKIKTDKGENEYNFRYYGDSVYWKKSKTSKIFIVYAYDEFGKGGSKANKGVDEKLSAYLTEIFEKELVALIDKKLRLRHIETK